MKKVFVTGLAMMAMTAPTYAGTLSLDMRADYNSTTYEKGTADSTKYYFKTGRLDYQGKATDDLSFRARIAFNKNANEDLTTRPDSTPAYVEYGYVSHKMADFFTLTVGKLNSELGGFEGGTSSADLYLTSEAYSHKAPLALTSNLFGTADLLYMTGIKATFSAEGQTFHLLATNESENAKTGTVANQNSSLFGAVWRGAFMDKALNFNLSYHTVNGAVKDDKFQFINAGVLWNSSPVTAQLDYLVYDFKKDTTGKIDLMTSLIGKLAYTGWENWTPRLELSSSEEKIEIASTTTNKFMGVGAVLEYKPYADTNFRYHVAYSNVRMEPPTGDASTKTEVVVGARLLADFLK